MIYFLPKSFQQLTKLDQCDILCSRVRGTRSPPSASQPVPSLLEAIPSCTYCGNIFILVHNVESHRNWTVDDKDSEE